MKKYVFLLAVLLSAISFNSCSSDSSEDVACTPIPCLNNGVSNDECGCDCPQGFAGDNCSIQITPSKILITKIVVTKFPNLKPNGNNWDAFALTGWERPDIFPSISNSQGNYLFAGNPINDSFSYGNDNFTFTPSTPIEITNFNNQFTVILWDDDGVNFTPEFMGGYDFYIYQNNGFPQILEVSTSAGAVAFKLHLSYQW